MLEHEDIGVVVSVGTLDAIALAQHVLATSQILGRAVIGIVLAFGVDGMRCYRADGKRCGGRGCEVDQSRFCRTRGKKPALAMG